MKFDRVAYYRFAIKRGGTPNIPPDLIERVFEVLTDQEVQNYLAQRRAPRTP